MVTHELGTSYLLGEKTWGDAIHSPLHQIMLPTQWKRIRWSSGSRVDIKWECTYFTASKVTEEF